MTPRENTKRLVAFDNPQRIGFTFSPYRGTPRLYDIFGGGAAPDPAFTRREWTEGSMRCWNDEWGNTWATVDERHKGEVIRGAITSWDRLDDYTPPSLDDISRYEAERTSFAENTDLYRMGGIPGCAFNSARYLRGFEQYLLDCAAEPEQVNRLNTMVADLVERVVDIHAQLGADGVFFCEDWGTQERLLVSPAMWRRLFLPHFERLASHAHSHGLHVWMHSCGYLADIIPDLIACGIDVLQFDQQENYPLETLAERYSGKVTFWCPVDIQRILQTQDKTTIQAYARRMRELLGGRGGGFVAKDYGDNAALGLSEDEQHWAYEAFMEVAYY